MQRREFLALTAGALGASQLSLTRARTRSLFDDSKPGEPRACELELAFGEARRKGRPLLVLLLPAREPNPEEPSFLDQMQDSIGAIEDAQLVHAQLLRFGDDRTLACLAACELALATPVELARHLPPTDAQRDALAVLVDVSGAQPVGVSVRAELPAVEDPYAILRREREAQSTPPASSDEPWTLERAEAEHQRQVVERAHVYGRTLQSVLVGAPSAQAQLAVAAAQSLDSAQRELLLGDLRANRLPPSALIEAGAGLALGFALRPEGWPALQTSLAELGRAQWLEEAPHGARWAEVGGCASVSVRPSMRDLPEAESGPRISAACGMGHTPASSREFLYFYARRASAGCEGRDR